MIFPNKKMEWIMPNVVKSPAEDFSWSELAILKMFYHKDPRSNGRIFQLRNGEDVPDQLSWKDILLSHRSTPSQELE